MATTNLSQGTVEWETYRRSHIGGSDIAAIIGLSPWKSAYDVYQEKVYGSKQEVTQAMQLGKAKESIARLKYMEVTGIVVLPAVIEYGPWNVAMASLDGLSDDEKHLVEIKCPSRKIIEECALKNIPDYYHAQIQWQLMCSGAECADYFCYYDDEFWAQMLIVPDPKMQEEMLAKAKEFWDMVEKRIEPPKPKDKYQEIESKEFEQIADAYREFDTMEKHAKDMKANLKEQLVGFADNVGTNISGYGIRVFSKAGAKVVDWKSVCKKYSISDNELAQFTTVKSSSWVVTINSSS